jgi:hypothetical protein
MQRLRRTLHVVVLFGQISSEIRCYGVTKRLTSHLLPTLDAESTHDSINRPLLYRCEYRIWQFDFGRETGQVVGYLLS